MPPGNAVTLLALAVREYHTEAIGDLSRIWNNFNPRDANFFTPLSTHMHDSEFTICQIILAGSPDS